MALSPTLIRPKDLTPRPTPVASEIVPSDNGDNVGGSTWLAGVNAARPFASQAEAEAGTSATTAMNPLTTNQAVTARIGVDIASKAQGDKADTAVQPARTITAGTGLSGGGDLSADRSVALSAGSQASLALADTAVQPARSISAGTGLTGGGSLAADRTLALSSGSISSLARADSALQPDRQGTTSAITFGATTSGSQTPADRRGFLQAAIDACAGTLELVIPAGTWIIDDTLHLPTGTRVRGVGQDLTIIKMADDALGDLPVILTGDVGDPRTNIAISDLTIDYNKARWGNAESGEGTALTGFHRGLAIVNSQFVYVRHVKVIDPYGYGIDVTSPAPTNAGPLVWNDEGCKYVWVEDCEVYGAGDDNFTTRMSSFVWFTRCYSHDTDRNGDGLSNGFEIDDGSRNVILTDCIAERCEVGFQVKGHGLGTGAPAAYNIQIHGGQAINNCQGFMLRNAAFSSATVENTFDDYPDTTTEFSTTASGVIVDGLVIIAPKRVKPAFTTLIGGMDMGNYTNVTLANITIDEGLEDHENNEYQPADALETYVVSMSTLMRRVLISNMIINGFRAADYGIRATSTVGGLDGRLCIFIDGLIVRDGPKFPVFFVSQTKDVYVENYVINGKHTADGGTGITIGGAASATRHCSVGRGRISGYQVPMTIAGFATALETEFMPGPVYIVDADGALVVADATASISAQAARLKTIASGSRAGMAVKANANSERIAIVVEAAAGVAGKITTISDATSTRTLFYLTSTIWISAGAGSPESVITAPIGCEWNDTTNGVKYMKKSGTGNTGWKLVTQAP